MKRVIGAALAACALLWAGSAGAATISGVVDQSMVRTGIETTPGALYEFSFSSEIAPIDLRVIASGEYNILYYDVEGRVTGGSWETPSRRWSAPLASDTAPLVLRDGKYVGRFEVPISYETYAGGSPPGTVRAVSYYRYSAARFVGIWDTDAIGTSWEFSVTAVPEPATWGMLIVGFGLSGAAIRRRRGGATMRAQRL